MARAPDRRAGAPLVCPFSGLVDQQCHYCAGLREGAGAIAARRHLLRRAALRAHRRRRRRADAKRRSGR
eukprot:13412607-Alexandrium_andersonii.AAC.1